MVARVKFEKLEVTSMTLVISMMVLKTNLLAYKMANGSTVYIYHNNRNISCKKPLATVNILCMADLYVQYRI